jgi:hypothetical protein
MVAVSSVLFAMLAAAGAWASAPPVGELPAAPTTTISVTPGQLFSIVLPRPAVGLSWRGARASDALVARPLHEGELKGNVVFVYRAGSVGETTVVYALTKDEQPEARAARFFSIVVGLGARCSASPEVAARFVIPPPPFGARLVGVRRQQLPPSEPAGRGPSSKRLYLVSFYVSKGNAVLPAGHRYSQFAYVSRTSTSQPWCFLKGGSGP